MAINDLFISYPDFKLGEMIDPEQFDQNNYETVTKINQIIKILNQITDSIEDGKSGADIISLTAINPFISDKLQAFLEEVIARLSSTIDGKSGADFIASTQINGVSGNTVQEQLESLKIIFDSAVNTLTQNINTVNTNQTDALNTHKNSSDHDSRYFTETELLQGILDTRYFTKTQVDLSLAGKSDINHTHTATSIGALVSVAGVSSPGGDIELIGGTGIIISVDEASKRIVITATTEAVPGPHMHNENELMLVGNYDFVTGIDLRSILTENFNIMNEFASGVDVNGIYTTIQYKRVDGTLYMESILSDADEFGNYLTNTWNLYALDGVALIRTIVWTLEYDNDGTVVSKTGVVS